MIDQLPIRGDAEAIAKEFKEYAYSVSHDLSAPARAMVEFSKLLLSEHADALNEEGKEYLALIIDNGKKLQSIMDGLLAYSRLNTMAKPFTQVDCNQIIENCQLTLGGKINATHARLETGNLPSLYADANQLTQLFMILLDNALKFQPSGAMAQIRIAAHKQDNMWQFSLSDNGIGIAPQFHERIFKLFHRLHTDDEYPGVGIGLTLAQKIIYRHGGKIWCEPNTQQGSIFLFTLPLRPPGGGS